jgi:hypothetical protein
VGMIDFPALCILHIDPDNGYPSRLEIRFRGVGGLQGRIFYPAFWDLWMAPDRTLLRGVYISRRCYIIRPLCQLRGNAHK